MMDVVIIDDESDASAVVWKMIGLYSPQIQVIGKADGIKSGIGLLRAQQPDTAFGGY